MGSKLDRSREYGTVWGDEGGRAFAQDGKYFDGLGNEIPGAFQTAEAAEAASKKPTKPPQGASASADKATNQTDKQLQG
jgi:hypothetical protein